MRSEKNKAVIHDFDHPEFPINVQIWTYVDYYGGYVYCGNGKFCRDEAEMEAVCKKYNVVAIEDERRKDENRAN